MDQKFEEIKEGYEDILVDHPIPSEKIFNKIEANIARKRLKIILFRCAAVLIPTVLILGLFYHLDSKVELFGEVDYEEVYVPKGERIQMMFQDGTRAYLNSDTRLKFPKKFSLSEREVFISGEAYFVVTENPKRPFIVNINEMSVKVLGTSFNVHAYPEENDITVFLEKGRIAEFIVEDPTVLNNYLTITCEDTNLDNILNGLENIVPVKFVYENGRIKIVAI